MSDKSVEEYAEHEDSSRKDSIWSSDTITDGQNLHKFEQDEGLLISHSVDILVKVTKASLNTAYGAYLCHWSAKQRVWPFDHMDKSCHCYQTKAVSILNYHQIPECGDSRGWTTPDRTTW